MTASKLQQGDIKHTGYVLRIRNITFWSALLSYIVYTIYVSAAYHRDTCIPVLSTKQVRLMNMSSLGYKYFLLLLSKFILPNSSSLCRCLIFATFLALCLYCDFLSIPLSFLPNRSDNEPDGFFFYLLATSILPCLLYVSRFRYVMMKIIHIIYKTN